MTTIEPGRLQARFLWVLPLLAAAWSGGAQGATCNWTGTSGGDWGTSGDWSCNAVPGASDTASIGSGNLVNISASESILTFTNAGTLDINAFLLNLESGGSTTNSGTINVGTSTVTASILDSNNINNTGGAITLSNGSVLDQLGTSITGGTLGTAGTTGKVVASSTSANVLNGVTLDGALDLTSTANSRERIINGLTLNGAVNVANGGILTFDSTNTTGSNQTIGGTGTINLNDSAARISVEGNGATTLGAHVLIQGQGEIGPAIYGGGTNVLTNNGTITANAGAGTSLRIDPPANSGSVTNNGILSASSSSTLVLAAVTNNAAGQIDATSAGVVQQAGLAINGGTINTSGGGVLQASSNSGNDLNGVTMNGTLDLTSIANARERIINGLTLNGVVNVQNGGILTFDSNNTTGGAQTLGGTATINLNDPNAKISVEGTGSTTLGAGVLIQGQGEIGTAIYAGGTNLLTSNGTISANTSGGTLTINAPGNSGSFVNNGTLEAQNGGTLVLSTNITNNTGSEIIAGTGSKVIQNGVTLNGILDVAAGSLSAISSSNNVFNAVTLTGNLDLTSVANAREQIFNSLTLNGAVNIANGGILTLSDNGTTGNIQSILGNANINLNDSAARLSLEGNGSTTLGANVLIQGQGEIGTAIYGGGTNVLTNNGTITANAGAGTTLRIDPPANSGSVTNNSILSAVNGSTLALASTINNAGQINATGGGVVEQVGVSLNGGTINTSGGGVLQANTSSVNFLNGVTLNGTLDLTTITNSRERIVNGLTLNGAVNVANGGILSFDSTNSTGGAQTLGGAATINLNDPAARISIEGTGSTTLGANVLIQGEGQIGTAIYGGGVNVLTNNGTITANAGAGTTLTVNPPANSGSVTNNGILSASNSSTLVLTSAINNTAAGQIEALAGSTVQQSGVQITGGTLGTTGSGTIDPNTSSNNVLSNVTLAGTLGLGVIGGAREQIINGLTLDGAIDVTNNGILTLNPGVAIGGAGTINLNDASARISIEGSGTTTLGANVLIQGQGLIGTALYNGGSNALTNNGTITANAAGGTLTIATPANTGTFINNNVLSASGGGTLALSSSITNTAAGQIEALAGGVVKQLGVTLAGGTLSSAGSGALQVNTSGNNFLSDVTLAGTLDMTSVANSRERIINGLTLNGTVNVANGGILSFDSTNTSGGSQTIGGTGTISLNDSAARISIEGNGSTTIGAGVLIRGQGLIGTALNNGGNNALTNLGSIIGTGGTLTISPPANSGSFTNTGLVQASGGTVIINPVLLGAGTLEVTGTGQLNLSTAGVNNTGVVLANGTNAGSLNLGSQNLIVSSDYNNANFGTGNAFNARANVAGTGLIEAGGNAAQAITGADVTNGGTTSATLTIGNVHVGANNYAYQIANTGTSGPSLRGAIQTSVNGASITDGRLSGSGVTASNYNTGGPGSNTGDLDVVFTAAGAGTLTALSGQSVNLASNFANIPNQKLNIVLGSGAAAYNLASGATTPSPVTIGNQRVGGSNSQVLTVGNNAPSGGFTEVLNAGFGANTGAATNNGGSISGGLGAGGVAAGGSNATAMSVGVNTATAGAQTGTVSLNYVSNGTGTSGLGNTSVGSQTITVSGNVYQVAAGAINTAPLNFGVVQVGQSVSQTLAVQNVATGAAGFVEDLNASFGSTSGTGASLISGTGSVSGLTAGSIDSSHMTVTANTASAGTVNGAIGVNFFTAGTVNGVSDGLGVASVGSGSYGVSGTIQTTGMVINDADPVIISPSPISLGNAHVGASSPVGFVSLTNQATSAPQASLNASITGNAPITASGSVTDLGPGGLDNTHLQVGMNTSAAGAVNGTATLGLVSDAGPAGCTSNCLLTLASQNVTVTGGVYQYAQPSVASSVNLGNVRVGGTATGTIGVTNTNISPAGYQEGLDASYQSGSGSNGASASGAITNLAAGSGGTLNAALTAGGAGVQSGMVTIGLTSNGTIDGLASTPLASQNVTVQASGYREANPLLAPGAITLNARVGDAAPSAALTVTNSSPDQYTEGLAGNLGAATGPFTNNGGSITNLAAQGVDGSTLKVGMSTATSGTFSGTQTVSFTSNGLIDNASAASVGTGTVNLTGNVYTTAVANVTPPTVSFGIVHVGDTVGAQALTVSNVAAGALNDVLTGGFASVTGPFTGTGTLSGLAAGAPADSSTLQLSMNTSTAGTYSGTATLGLLSHDGALSDVAAVNGGATVGLSGQVNYHATPTFELTGSGNTGGLTGSGDAFTLNLGTLTAGESITDLIEFLNGAPGQADALGGSFADAGSVPGLTLSGFDMVSGLLDGQGETGEAMLDTTGLAAGSTFTDVLTFTGTGSDAGSNGNPFSEDLSATLTITGEIGTTTTNVPEPDPLALILIGGGGLLILLGVRRRRAVTPSARTAALS